MAALTIWTPGGGLLSYLAPLGLAAAAGTALVVDLDPSGPVPQGSGSLAELISSGPRREDLRPAARGVVLLPNGGVDREASAPVVAALLEGWPAVVFSSPVDDAAYAPIVPVIPLYPGPFSPSFSRFAVFQRTGFEVERPARGIVLPRPSNATVGRMLRGEMPGRSRWVSAWRAVWEHPWH